MSLTHLARVLVSALVPLVPLVATACGATSDALARTPDSASSTAQRQTAARGAAKSGSTPRPLASPSGSEPAFTAESTTVIAPLRLPSQLYVEQDALVGARSAGVLRTLTVNLGSAVSAGQTIGQQDDDAERLALARADVVLENARKSVERARTLRTSGSITGAELDDAEYQFKLADVARREAERAVELTRVVAPFDGVVTARYAQPGRLLAMHDSVARVTARGPQLARGRLPESAHVSISTGSAVAIVTPAGRRVAARVIRLSPSIDAASGTREFIVQASSGADLVTGSAVSLELASSARRVLAVPRAAIGNDGYVVVLSAQRATLRPVVTGAEFGDQVEVRSGLQAGERVRRQPR